MNEDPSLPASTVIDPLFVPPQTDHSFEREPKPERRAFNDLFIEVYGQRKVIDADIGVNKGALDTYYPEGLLCYLYPYDNQESGDFIELFCGNVDDPVAFTSVTDAQAEKGEKIPLFIPYPRLPEGLIQPLFFRLTRFSGGNPGETPHYSLLVDTIPPAGPHDPIPSTPWHEELAPPLPPQFVIDYGVDKGTAEQGVPVTIEPYPLDESAPASWKMAEHDKVRLFIGGVPVPVHTVTWDEANNRRTLTLTIYYETWLKVGDGQKVLEYEVIDQCGNYSVKWSPQTVLRVDIGNDSRPRLPYAYIEESAEFGAEFDTVDYDLIGEDDDATLVITTIRQGYQMGDSVHVVLEGRTAQGAIIRETIDYPLQDADTRRNIELPLRNEILRELVGGTAVLSYQRIRPGTEPQPSEVTRLVIVGSFLSRLAKPLVLEAIGDFLDPTSLLATVEISPYIGQQSSDRVDLYLLGTRANSEREFWHFFKMAGSTDDPVIFRLKHDLDIDIAGLNGGKLEVHYVVTNAEGERESLHTPLNVGEATATLPLPKVPEAPDGVLDPETETDGATVVVPRAANLEEGDLLSVYWQGSKPGGNFSYRKFEVTSAWLDSDIPFPIEREYVDANKGGSVKVFYIVERGREPVRYSHVFPLTVGTALQLKKPEVLETTEPGGNQLNPINAETAVTVRVRYDGMKNTDDIRLYWKGVDGIGSPDIPPQQGNAAQGYVDFTLSGATAVGPNIGKTVEVSYEMTRAGATQPSPTLNLTVQSLPVSALPSLQILQANSGQVDVNGTVTFRVDAWPFYRRGDRVWLALESDDPDGGLNRLPIWTASAINSSEFNQKYLQRVITSNSVHAAWLRALPSGREVRVVFKVVFGGGSDEADALVFPVLKIGVLPQPQWPRSKMSYLSWQNMAATETLHVPAWAFSEQGQQVWLTLEGRTALGASKNLPIDVGTTITATEAQSGLNRAIAKSYFDQLGHNTPLRVTGQISLDGGRTRVNLPPLEITFTHYFLLAANRADGYERGRFVPEVPGTFAFIMPSATMGPTTLKMGGSGFTSLSIPVTNNQGASRNVVVRGERAVGSGPRVQFNNAGDAQGGGSTFMHLTLVMQDNSALPTGSYKGTFKTILKGYTTPSFEQDVWVQVLIEK